MDTIIGIAAVVCSVICMPIAVIAVYTFVGLLLWPFMLFSAVFSFDDDRAEGETWLGDITEALLFPYNKAALHFEGWNRYEILATIVGIGGLVVIYGDF